MRKLTVFNSVSLDGYFTGENGDLSWAHSAKQQDPEWTELVEGNAKSGGQLLFGRKTYEMMKSYWPTPEAMRTAPAVAEQMNKLPKVVFSKSMDKATWTNTKVVQGDLVAELRKLKQEPGPDLVLMGSGSIISQVAPAGVIDEYQMVLIPVVLGKGRTMFDGMKEKIELKPIQSRTFANGNVLMRYEPVGAMAASSSSSHGRH